MRSFLAAQKDLQSNQSSTVPITKSVAVAAVIIVSLMYEARDLPKENNVYVCVYVERQRHRERERVTNIG